MCNFFHLHYHIFVYCSPEEESSTSSSDEDEEEDKAADELLGKVVCVSLNIGDKKKVNWVPALVRLFF